MKQARNKIRRSILWSEKLFKTDVLYLVKGGSWLSLSHTIAMVTGFGLSLAFANFISAEAYGNYKYVLSMAGIIGSLTLTGMGTALTQSVAKGFEPLLQAFKTVLTWSFGIFVVALILATYYFVRNNNLLAFSFALVSLVLPVSNSTKLYGSYLLGKKDFKRSSLYGMISNFVPAILLILALIFTKNIWVIVTIYFLSLAILSTIFFKKVLGVYNIKEKDRLDLSLFSYGAHLSLMDILSRVAGSLDKILIFHYLGAAPLAIFSFAIAPVEQLQGGKKILSTLILPKLSGRPFKDLQRSTPKKALVLVIYALLLAAIWFIAAPYFYELFYPQYINAIPYSQIYSLTLLAIGSTLFQETLVAHQKTKELYFHRTIIPIIQLFLFFIIIPLYGISGLIIVHIVMRILSGLVAFYLVKYPL